VAAKALTKTTEKTAAKVVRSAWGKFNDFKNGAITKPNRLAEKNILGAFSASIQQIDETTYQRDPKQSGFNIRPRTRIDGVSGRNRSKDQQNRRRNKSKHRNPLQK
jgi:hypothetical protein